MPPSSSSGAESGSVMLLPSTLDTCTPSSKRESRSFSPFCKPPSVPVDAVALAVTLFCPSWLPGAGVLIATLTAAARVIVKETSPE